MLDSLRQFSNEQRNIIGIYIIEVMPAPVASLAINMFATAATSIPVGEGQLELYLRLPIGRRRVNLYIRRGLYPSQLIASIGAIEDEDIGETCIGVLNT